MNNIDKLVIEKNITTLDKKPSSEENFIIEFLESKNFKFDYEKHRLTKLRGDTKGYRIPDFYLKNYNVYVEYYGLYNSTKDIRAEYDFKTSIYIKNDIPTVFLYPHELGILDYVFHTKLIKVLKLKKFNLKKQLLKYKVKRFISKTSSSSFAILFFAFLFDWVLIKMDTGLKRDFVLNITFVALGPMIVSIIFIFIDFWKYFIKDKY